MTPPPEQYVLETPRELAGARERRHVDTSPGSLTVPTTDLTLLASWTALLGVLNGRISLSVLLVIATLVATVPFGVTRGLNPSVLEDIGSLVRRCTAGFALAAAVGALRGIPAYDSLMAATGALALLVAGRAGARALQRRAARAGSLSRTLIVGSGGTAGKLIAFLRDDPDYGLEVVGAVGGGGHEAEQRLGTRVLGRIDRLVEVAEARHVGTVVIAFDDSPDKGTIRQIRRLLHRGIDVWVVPRFFEVGATVPVQHIGGIPVMRLRPPAHRRLGWAAKRPLDIAVAGIALAISAPFLLLIAVAVKLDSPGPALFRQERFGKGKRPFWMLKFRTMVVVPPDQEDRRWETDEDRITRVGGFLRSTNLDELPQLFNVLRGDLSLVGPRPERPRYVDSFEALYPGYSERHRVPAGVTGWAQVHGLRGETSMRHRARFDNYYIENWSLSSDVKILILTARTFLRRYRTPTASIEREKQESEQDLAKVG